MGSEKNFDALNEQIESLVDSVKEMELLPCEEVPAFRRVLDQFVGSLRGEVSEKSFSKSLTLAVRALNDMEEEFEFIETDEREALYRLFIDAAELVDVDSEVVEEVLEEERDW